MVAVPFNSILTPQNLHRKNCQIFFIYIYKIYKEIYILYENRVHIQNVLNIYS